ncbi:hypothetical protein LCGC14_2328700, partial [marine sediment metagenome]
YRLAKKKYSNDLSGAGAEINGGRWNNIGTKVVYTSSSRALACLEVAVHVKLNRSPKNYCIITLDIPMGIIKNLDTAILEAESVQIFKGIISDFPVIDYNTVDFNIERYDLIKEADVGNTFVSDDDVTGTQPLPANSHGKSKQIIYGDHKFYVGNVTRSLAASNYKNNMIPMIDLGVDDITDKHYWFLADHLMNSIDTIWGLESTIARARPVQLKTFTIEQNTAAGAIISHDINEEFYDYWFGDGTATPVGGSDFWDDEEKAGDRDLTVGGQTASINEFSSFNDAQFDLHFPTLDSGVADADISEVAIFAFADGSNVHANWTFTINAADATAFTLATAVQAGVQAATNVGAAADVRVAHGGPIGDESTALIIEIYKRIAYKPTQQLQLLASCGGREYGPWINGRSTVEGYTETHQDNDNENSLMENAPGIIESIIRDEIGLNAEHLNENDFATHAKWNATNDFDDTGNNATYTWSANQTSSLTQTAANRLKVGTGNRKYKFIYNLTETVAFDGDGAITITSTGFASETITIPLTAGTGLFVELISKVTLGDFVIQIVSGTDTQGT